MGNKHSISGACPKSKGFSLIEVLVAGVVISVVSAATWMGTSAFMRSAEISMNRSMALNLLQKSQEEVRRAAQPFFDQLESCQFPSESLEEGSGLCGFSKIAEEFKGFSRTLLVEPAGSQEIKKSSVTVAWNEFSQTKTMSSVVFISRPPDPLPGNVKGLVYPQGKPAVLIDGAQITITRSGRTESSATTSQGVLSPKNCNFDFSEPGTGRFILNTGSWLLRATKAGYYDYIHPEPIIVDSNQETPPVLVAMEAKPEDATIHIKIEDSTKGLLVTSFDRAFTSIFDDGKTGDLPAPVSNQKEFSFNVPFSDSEERCLTINTNDAFKAGYAGFPSCSFQYQKEGWSSAVSASSGALTCSNPWNGNALTDRICVSPGDNQNLKIPLSPVPEVLISGRVVDSNGNPIANATVYAAWPRSDADYWRKSGAVQTARTDSSGRFTNFSVPAVQGLFPDTNPYNNYLRVWASGSVPIQMCCNLLGNQTRDSQTIEVGPLFPGDPPRNTANLVIVVADRVCGNVSGHVLDDLTKGSISVANITVTQTEPTDFAGIYRFECPPQQEGFRLPQGQQQFRAQKNGYYENSSVGNTWYSRRSSSGNDVNVRANRSITYDAKMWPKGYGTIQGTVRDKNTGNPVSQANVVLTLYDSSRYSFKTGTDGRFQFQQVIETWPPPALPADDPYYQHNLLTHRIEAWVDSSVYLPNGVSIPQLLAGQTLERDILLSMQGGI